jgi:hypothetical protein
MGMIALTAVFGTSLVIVAIMPIKMSQLQLQSPLSEYEVM